MKLNKPEINHLLGLISSNEQEGNYYAPRLQYWRRSERIKIKLERELGSINKIVDEKR